MDFLKRAEDYTHARGDLAWFKELYSLYRTKYSVRDSIREVLWQLYNDDQMIANLEYQ